MSKNVKWVLISIGVLVVLLVTLSLNGFFGEEKGVKVSTEKVQRRTINEVVNASGKIFPEIEVKVSPDISGEITELIVQEGDSVKKGQLLARIYADIYDIQSKQAASGVTQSQAQVANSEATLVALQAQLDQAEKTYNMQKRLYDDKVISQSEFNIAESNYRSAKANYDAAVQGIRGSKASVESAEANLAKANKDLSRTAVIAPMDGVISLLNVKKGERVVGSNMMAGTEMLRIADMSKIEIRVDVGENDIPKVKLGDSAVVQVDAYNERKFKGIVTQIASSNTGAASQTSLSAASTDVTQYKVYIRLLPESYADLSKLGSLPFRPGMSANADIQTKTHQNKLSVPINAVTTRERNDSIKKEVKKTDEAELKQPPTPEDNLDVVVFVVGKENKVSKVKVKTDIQDINYIEIQEGLKEGEEVVTGPYEVVSKTLKQGMEIKKAEKSDLFEKEK